MYFTEGLECNNIMSSVLQTDTKKLLAPGMYKVGMTLKKKSSGGRYMFLKHFHQNVLREDRVSFVTTNGTYMLSHIPETKHPDDLKKRKNKKSIHQFIFSQNQLSAAVLQM